jgi:hypothetical protein
METKEKEVKEKVNEKEHQQDREFYLVCVQ